MPSKQGARSHETADRRFATLWPLPGGRARYAETLREMLVMASEAPTRSELEDAVYWRYGLMSRRTARGYVGVLTVLDMIEIVGRKPRLTPRGRAFRRGSVAALRAALVERVGGVREMLETLSVGPLPTRDLREALAMQGTEWGYPMAVHQRLWWLESAGVVTGTRRSRADIWRLTPAGRRLVNRPPGSNPKR